MQIYLDETFAKSALPKRRDNAHKGSFGTLHILAGSAQYRGAAVLGAAGALRAGTGLLRLFSTERVCAAAAAQLPCCILHPLPESKDGSIAAGAEADVLGGGASAVLAGSGMGHSRDTAALTRGLLQGAACPLVLDADALNAVSGAMVQEDTAFGRGAMLQLVQNSAAQVVLTPHIGEMARLTGLAKEDITARQAEVAAQFAAAHRCTVVLKSHVTVVASCTDEAIYVNNSAGNAGLAKGGSGDVLAGVIASLCAQGLPVAKAAALGVWLHAAAADEAARDYGLAALSPMDLPNYLARVLKSIGR